MAKTILFANSSDYCSSGFLDPNKQIIPNTNASAHSCPLRADYTAARVSMSEMYVCILTDCLHICSKHVCILKCKSIPNYYLIEWDI